MTTEQKAKAYDEAIRKAKITLDCCDSASIATKNTVYDIFPELKESEDERIRGAIIDHLKDNNLTEWAAWLKKQGKPSDKEMKTLLRTEYEKGRADAIAEMQKDWSEEDELHIRELESLVKQEWAIAERENDKDRIHKMRDLSFFLKILKPHLKQEWTEEDESMYTRTLGILGKCCMGHIPTEVEEELNWFKSRLKPLRPQNNITDEELAQAKKNAYNDALDKIEYHSGEPTFDDGWHAAILYLKKRNAIPQNTWKPTEAQLTQLGTAVSKGRAGYFNNDVLRELYVQLKQL